MIRSFNFGYNVDKYGNAYENAPGYEMWRKGMFFPRITRHFSSHDKVYTTIFHRGSDWKKSNSVLVMSYKDLMEANGISENYHSVDTWWAQRFGKRFMYPKGKFSMITPFDSMMEYSAKLRERGLYPKEGPLPPLVEDPSTKEIFYLNNQLVLSNFQSAI